LISDLLKFNFKTGFDVFNALDLMENKEFLKELKFGKGDGNLQYYVYNWRCPSILPHKVAFTEYIIQKKVLYAFNFQIGLVLQ
jgi:glycylpeptide N-tetradecanoyltransferase